MKNLTDVVCKRHGSLPERVLQIGEGNFLRAFADWMIDTMNDHSVFEGSVVLAQPIPQGLKEKINGQNGMYTVMMRGVEAGAVVEKTKVVTSVSRCINPYEEYDQFLRVAVSEELKVIISNTTEAGIAYRKGDQLKDTPPLSYPAKMTALLYRRYGMLGGRDDAGLLILPVELIDRNGDMLKKHVRAYALEWELETGFLDWLNRSVCFANTLVDRIVTGFPRGEIDAICEKLGYRDDLLVTCEPFCLWVIEAPEKYRKHIPFDKAGLPVIWTDDMTPYRTRKVRILNGAHTVSVLSAYLCGHETVLDMMNDPIFDRYLRTVIWDEIIPYIPLEKAEMDAFASAVLERFSNPFIHHRLLDISLNSVSKYKVRCLPSLLDYVAAKHTPPKILTFGLAALIQFYKGEGNPVNDSEEVVQTMLQAWQDPAAAARRVLSQTNFWGQDLTGIPGLLSEVEKHLEAIGRQGIRAVVDELVGEISCESKAF